MHKVIHKICFIALMLILPTLAMGATIPTVLPEVMVGQTTVTVKDPAMTGSILQTFYGGLTGNESVLNYSVPGQTLGKKYSTNIKFDGTNGYLKFTDNPVFRFNNSYTISLWLKSNDSDGGTLLQKSASDASGQQQYLSYSIDIDATNKLKAKVWSNSVFVTLTAPNAINTNQWNHVAFTRVGNSCYLYVNGVLVAGTSGNLLDAIGRFDANPLYMGGGVKTSANLINGTPAVGTASAMFKGSIAEVRMYNAAVNVSDIYNGRENDTSLLAHWDFSDGSGTIVHDKTYGHYDGTLVGTQDLINHQTGQIDWRSEDGPTAVNPTGPIPNFKQTSMPVAGAPISAVTGDFNGDGKSDIVTANYTNNSVSILINDGSGSFTKVQDKTVGTIPRAIVAGYFNNDSRLDLAVANYTSGTVSVLLNNVDRTFANAVTYTVGAGYRPISIVAGDFTNDGIIDLVTANSNSGNNKVSLLKGNSNGNGTFPTIVDIGTGAGTMPFSVAAGDFDRDGNLDLATANMGGSIGSHNSVSILKGNGSGSFSLSYLTTGDTPSVIIAADFNKDGKIDLATNDGNNVAILQNTNSVAGTMSFASVVNYPIGNAMAHMVSGDINGDGKIDIIAGCTIAKTLSILTGNGDGTFKTAVTVDAGGKQPYGLAIADFSGDDRLDVVTTNYSLSNDISILTNITNSLSDPASGYSPFGFNKDYLQGDNGNLVGCLAGIVFNVINPQTRCYVSNNKSTQNISVMTSRTYVGSSPSPSGTPVSEIAALLYPPKPLLVGDAYLGGMDPTNFAYWGRNLTQNSGATYGTSSDSFLGINYSDPNSYNKNAQASLDSTGTEYLKYKAKIDLAKSEATVASATISTPGKWFLQSNGGGTGNDIENNNEVLTKYPDGRIWKSSGDLTLTGAFTYQGKGTVIVQGDLTISANTSILPSDVTSRLGFIVYGNVTIVGNNNIQAAILSLGGSGITIQGSNVNLLGSFVATDFSIPATGNTRIYYDPALDTAWPPGFKDLKMPHPVE